MVHENKDLLEHIKGRYTGYYAYSDPRITKMRGVPKTVFYLHIDSSEGSQFSGTVTDDLATGGMEGIGTIHGNISGREVSFVKQMPTLTVLVNKHGKTRKFNEKHSPVYYTGILSDDGRIITGTWHMKFRFIWFGILPIPMAACKGSWSMTLME